MIDDTLSTLRPKLKQFKTFEDACAHVAAIEQKLQGLLIFSLKLLLQL